MIGQFDQDRSRYDAAARISIDRVECDGLVYPADQVSTRFKVDASFFLELAQRALLEGLPLVEEAARQGPVTVFPAPDQRNQPRFQLFHNKRFRQEIVSALVKGPDFFGQRIARGQDQHRRTVVPRADLRQQGMAIHARKSEIKDDRVELFNCQPPFGNQPVIGPLNDEASVPGQAS